MLTLSVVTEERTEARWEELRGEIGAARMSAWAELPPAFRGYLVQLEQTAQRYGYLDRQLKLGSPVHLGLDARCGVVVRVAGRVVATGGDAGLDEAMDQVLTNGPM